MCVCMCVFIMCVHCVCCMCVCVVCMCAFYMTPGMPLMMLVPPPPCAQVRAAAGRPPAQPQRGVAVRCICPGKGGGMTDTGCVSCMTDWLMALKVTCHLATHNIHTRSLTHILSHSHTLTQSLSHSITHILTLTPPHMSLCSAQQTLNHSHTHTAHIQHTYSTAPPLTLMQTQHMHMHREHCLPPLPPLCSGRGGVSVMCPP